ncbi:hypothetical protein H4J69_15680 [Colwellia sp. BRX10-9]|uniref:hypothetical protein n=1 Tax=Colwellia sp. BRX10-6 TaxID=2759841 RepID=UPI0015F371A8|nr:hypothetical protein [Colwellia sp. BRX10-6]MBA6384478.1 hypothetical protein [Colwellia sp. BRX10-9]
MSFDCEFKDKLLIFILIIISASPILPNGVRLFLLVLVISFLILKLINKKVTSLLLLFVGVFTISLTQDAYYITEYGFNTGSLIYIPLSLFSGYLVAQSYHPTYFLNIYEKIVSVLCILALVLYAVFMSFPQLIVILPDYSYYNMNNKTAYFLNVLTSESGKSIGRNSGFASEPGLYQFFINLALWWRLRRNKGAIDLISWVYVATIVTTNSTVGILCLLLILFINSSRSTFFLIIILSIVSFPLLVSTYEYQLQNKLMGSDAFRSRLEPFINAINYSLVNLAGIGSVKYSAIYEALNIGGWDSFSQTILRYGYQGFIVLSIALASVVRMNLAIGIVIIALLCAQNLWFVSVVSVFYFWALDWNKSKALYGAIQKEST